jgi:hypothetical protein
LDTPAYDELTRTWTRLHHLGHLQSMAGWDRSAMMPPKGSEARAGAMAEMDALLHRIRTDAQLAQWLQRAADEDLGEIERGSMTRSGKYEVVNERGACAEVAARIGPRAASLAGRTGLGELVALAAHASVAVCNDSGLAHLCGAAGAPTVAVFGSTSSAWTAPLGPRVRVVQRAPVCSPCFARTCRIGYACLEGVTVRHVLAACDGLLAEREAA